MNKGKESGSFLIVVKKEGKGYSLLNITRPSENQQALKVQIPIDEEKKAKESIKKKPTATPKLPKPKKEEKP